MADFVRKYPRYHLVIEVNVKTEEQKNFAMSTIDVSLEGMRLLSHDKFVIIETQDFVTVSIPKIKSLEPLQMKAQVRHYSFEEGGRAVYGLQLFIDENKNAFLWRDYINQTVSEKKSP